MKTLLILRHAKSSWKDTTLADHDRPLNKRGLRDAPRMGELLREKDLIPDLILCSTAKRAKMTANGVAEACEYNNAIAYKKEIYHEGLNVFISLIKKIPETTAKAMIIGHNPDMESFVYHLTGKDERMPTAALAEIELDIESWKDLKESTKGKLNNIFRPKEIL